MPVEIVNADIFELDVDARVNPTNAMGVMGKGLAKSFVLNYPGLEDAYKWHKRSCSQWMTAGDLWQWTAASGDIVICVATKGHWREKSTVKGVRRGLLNLRTWCQGNPGKSIAVPALGCGLGELDWEVVRPLMLDILGSVPNAVYVIEPQE